MNDEVSPFVTPFFAPDEPTEADYFEPYRVYAQLRKNYTTPGDVTNAATWNSFAKSPLSVLKVRELQ